MVTLKQTADSILRDFYKSDKESDIVAQKTRLIEAAAKLIRHDIKDIVSVKDVYPSHTDISSIIMYTCFNPSVASLAILVCHIL